MKGEIINLHKNAHNTQLVYVVLMFHCAMNSSFIGYMNFSFD